MTSDVIAPATETTAAIGHGEAHSTAGFKALLIGCIGAVYGDIATSPLYALREAVVAASGPSGVVNPQGALGHPAPGLRALVGGETLKYWRYPSRAASPARSPPLAAVVRAHPPRHPR